MRYSPADVKPRRLPWDRCRFPPWYLRCNELGHVNRLLGFVQRGQESLRRIGLADKSIGAGGQRAGDRFGSSAEHNDLEVGVAAAQGAQGGAPVGDEREAGQLPIEQNQIGCL